ncbi:unnamed protein product [Trichobilharzia regenti]|nr:unnamed protein product [Trichobilharzia regenti]
MVYELACLVTGRSWIQTIGVGRGNSSADYSGPTRTYRGQTTRALTRGKWYYEAEILTSGFVRVGWAKKSAPPDLIIGSSNSSFAFAAHQVSEDFDNLKVC